MFVARLKIHMDSKYTVKRQAFHQDQSMLPAKDNTWVKVDKHYVVSMYYEMNTVQFVESPGLEGVSSITNIVMYMPNQILFELDWYCCPNWFPTVVPTYSIWSRHQSAVSGIIG